MQGNSEEKFDHALIGKDIQALADLSNSYNVLENMSVVPITKSAMIMLATVTIAPVLPLVLTIMPLDDWIKMFTGVLF
ncbi:MAG: hypothetical protein OEV74_10665 [Cyclobacteriaceae bacterium]|jgi:hypothetical protein|nr:hypothetical protein [Cyclobacteriaceae bacterium]MDH4296732.1 hypothetical protein [Cyclobacteriaceae bacterium]MDH5250186.1 hypothetical protein [Cyclobacteriaceae bacterium]